MPQPRKIIARRLSDQIETELMSMLQAGDYGPGDRLPSERELMEMFDVGRSSVREALFSLQRKGLLKINRGDRPRVIEPEPARLISEFSDMMGIVLNRPAGILHFNQARQFFEASVARNAAEVVTPAGLVALDVALVKNESAIGDMDRFRASDIAFHRTIAEITGNPIVLSVYDALVEWVMGKRVLRGDIERNNRASHAGHAAIAAAIRTGDAAAAYDHMVEHIARAESEYQLPN